VVRRHLYQLVALCLLPAASCLLVTACQPARLTPREPPRGQVLRINLHRGIGYAPLLIMQSRRLLERRVPGLSVEWKAIPAAETIHEALASGGLDIATGSPTDFLAAREAALPARVLAGLAELPLALVSARPEVRSIRDLGPDDRIAVPTLGGQEHVILRMAALRELGDWQALDRLVVAKPHPDAFAALLARGEITAHMAIPPYLDQALESPGLRRLLDAADVLGGPTTMVVAYTTPALREGQATLVDVFREALGEATDLAARDPDATAKLLVDREGFQLPPATLARYLTRPGLTFSTRVRGLPRLATFLQVTGQLERAPTAWRDLAFDDAPGP
jgi:ABC-type nitrate/sulfonate/bicarbonate transport system substrate-binding protein